MGVGWDGDWVRLIDIRILFIFLGYNGRRGGEHIELKSINRNRCESIPFTNQVSAPFPPPSTFHLDRAMSFSLPPPPPSILDPRFALFLVAPFWNGDGVEISRRKSVPLVWAPSPPSPPLSLMIPFFLWGRGELLCPPLLDRVLPFLDHHQR